MIPLTDRASEPFDWPRFFKTLPLQPVPAWMVCALALRPLARATPRLLHASCQGSARQGVVDSALVVYVLLLPTAAAVLPYLLFGRRRMSAPHRRIGDWCLAMLLVIAAFNGAGLARRVYAGWPILGPGLTALRVACWK